MRRIRQFIICAVLLVVSACDKNETFTFLSKTISIELGPSKLMTAENIETKSFLDDAIDDEQYVLVSEDNRAIAISREICNMPDFDSEVETKAQRYDSEDEFANQSFGLYCWDITNNEVVYSNETVSKSGGKWVPATAKRWNPNTTLNLEAVYPKPTTTSGELKLITSSNLSNLEFGYSVPVKADDQEDLMFACYSGTGNQGKATLIFTHALTCVKFKTGTLSGIASINSISLSGVHEKGNCTVNIEEGSEYSYNWTPSGSTTVYNDVVKTTLTSGTDLGNDYTFMLINQNLSEKPVTLTVNLTDTEGYYFNASVSLNEGEWESGKINSYILGSNGSEVNVNVTDIVNNNVKNNLVISNTGTAKAYIRATFVAGWYNHDGEMVEAWAPSQGTFTGLPGEGWTLCDDDGFYYHKDPVNAGTATATKLFESYSCLTPLSFGLHLEMKIIAQAVIYDSSKVRVKEAWGDKAAELLNK